MTRRWSVRAHLYALAAVVAVPLAVLLLWGAADAYFQDVHDAEGRARWIAQVSARELERYLEGAHLVVDQLAALPSVRQLDRVETEEALEAVLGLHPEFRDLVVTDATGRILNAPRTFPEAVSVGQADGEWLALAQGPGGQPELILNARILSKEGTRRGRVVALVDLPVLAERLLPGATPTIESGVLARDGTLLLHPVDRGRAIGQRITDSELLAALGRQAPAAGFVDAWGGRRQFFVLEPLGAFPASAYAMVPVEEIARAARRTLWRNLGAIALGIAVLAALVRVLAQRITAPMEALTAAAQSPARDALRVPEAGPREVADTATAFNAMLAQQRETELALRRSEEFFRGVFDEGGGAVLISGPDRRIERANSRACALLGYTLAELRQRTWIDLTHPDDRGDSDQRWVRVQRGEIDRYEADQRCVQRHGGIVHLALAANVLRGPDGRVERLIVHAADITGRKIAEAQRRESEQRLELALRGGDLGWWDYDLVAQRAVANARFAELTGYPPGTYERNPRIWEEWVHPEDRSAVRAAFATHRGGFTPSYELEHRLVRPDGEIWWALARGLVTERDPDGGARRFSGTIRDITVRKRAELDLAAQRQRFEDLVQSLAGIVWEEDLVTRRFTFVSRRAEEILGYPLERWRDEANFWVANLHPEDRSSAVALRDSATEANGPQTFVYRMLAADGRAVWLHETVSVVTDDSGRARLRRGVMLDVTARRQAEERLQGVVRALPDVIFVLDEAGVYLECFTGAPELLLLPREQMLGRHYRDLLPADLAARVDAGFAQLRAGAELVTLSYSLEVRGRWQHFEARCVPCEGGRILLVVRNVTSRAEAEAALRASEERYRLVIEQTGQLVYDADLQTGAVRWFGEAAAKAITGLELAELQHVNIDGWLARIHPDDLTAVTVEFERAGREAGAFRGEYRYRQSDGLYRMIDDVGVAVLDAAGKPARMLGRMSDLTELLRHRHEREQLARKLQETQKLESLGVLAGGIAHDFNNLLTGVLGNASLLRLELPANAPGLESVADIEKAAEAAADLCKQMLAYAGKGRISVQRLDLRRLVEASASLLQVSVSKRAQLHFQLAAVPAIEADATQLRQILMNFVINASEAIVAREGRIDIRVDTVEADRAYLAGVHLADELAPGPYVFLEVADNGTGMSRETLARIFDPFFTTKFTGRGLGLAAVLGIVRGHRGAIRVTSREGVGTTFRVLFPSAGAWEETTRTPPGKAAAPAALAGTALVVDDEVSVRKVATRLLSNFGFDIVTANDGLAALELFRASPARFRFVLLDLTMPQMDGRETFRRLRAERPDLPVVFASGFNAQDATELFGRELATEFLQKPFSVETLGAAVRRVLGGGGMSDPR